jgi:hypothetical protein
VTLSAAGSALEATVVELESVRLGMVSHPEEVARLTWTTAHALASESLRVSAIPTVVLALDSKPEDGQRSPG